MQINNTSTLFKDNVLGGKSIEEQQEDIERVRKEQEIIGVSNMRFEEKIMGGQSYNRFMEGKLDNIEGISSYNDKVNNLTNVGFKMENQTREEEIKSNIMGNQTNPFEKVNEYFNTKNNKKLSLGLSSPKDNTMDILGVSTFKANKAPTSILGKKKQTNIDNYLGLHNNNFNKMKKGNNIDSFFSNPFNTKKNKFSMQFNKVNFNNNVNNFLGTSTANPANKVNQILGNFKNPELVARNRMKQQTGLSLFGDYDRDGNLNIFDSRPRGQEIRKILGDRFSMNNEEKTFYYTEGNAYTDGDEDMSRYTFDELLRLAQTEVPIGRLPDDPEERKIEEQRRKELKRRATSAKTLLEEFRKREAEQAKTKQTIDRFGFDKKKYEDELKAKEKEQKLKEETELKKLDLQYGLDPKIQEIRKKELEREDEIRKEDLRREDKKIAMEQERKEKEIALQQEQFRARTKLDFMRLDRDSDAGLFKGKGLETGMKTVSALTGYTGTGQGLGWATQGGTGTGFIDTLQQHESPRQVRPEMLDEGMAQRRTIGSGAREALGDDFTFRRDGVPFSLKAQEALGLVDPRQLALQQQQLIEMQQQAEMQRQQEIEEMRRRQIERQQVQPQPYEEAEYQEVSQIDPDEVDWGSIDPKKAKTIDPDYGRYLKESKGQVTYRRGPYKRRQQEEE